MQDEVEGLFVGDRVIIDGRTTGILIGTFSTVLDNTRFGYVVKLDTGFYNPDKTCFISAVVADIGNVKRL